MSEKRCCCNCRHNIRTGKPHPVQYVREIGKSKIEYVENVIEYHDIENHCEIDGHYIGYCECFEGWCHHWAKDKKFESMVDTEVNAILNGVGITKEPKGMVADLLESEVEE